MNVDDLINAGEEMHQALGREYYLTLAGHKDSPDFQPIYDKFDFLQSDDALAVVRESGSLEMLEWIADIRTGRRVAPCEERQIMWERQAVVRVGGKEVPYLRAPIELANSSDRAYRIALDNARTIKGREIHGVRRDRLALEHDVMTEITDRDYVDSVSQLSGMDLDDLGEKAVAFLDATTDLYVESLSQLVKRRLGRGLDGLVRADIPWTFRADQYDTFFTPDRLVDVARGQMEELGFELTRGGRIVLDTEEREGKQARAFCARVRVPEEIYLVVRPSGGHTDYRTFWHEFGHSMHFASIPAASSFAARWLGDASVTEGFAMLWDHMTLRPLWLRRFGGLCDKGARELAFDVGVNELYLIRRHAAKLLYELSLHRSGFDGLGAEYAERLTEATRFQYKEDDYLIDVDPGFYVARYLRAWQLEAVLSSELTERFDEDWFRNPRAAPLLEELMAHGQAIPAHKLATQVSRAGLSFATVIRRLEPVLA